MGSVYILVYIQLCVVGLRWARIKNINYNTRMC